MSNANSDAPTSEVSAALRSEAQYGVRILGRHWWRFALLFAALVLPLWAFGGLAEEVREGEPFFFDVPVLEWMHGLHRPGFDALFLFFTRVGYAWGVVPFDLVLVAFLAWRRRRAEGLFAGVAVFGSALLNLAAKHWFGRARPDLWLSLVPETSYSFPSGHAMGSMTLATVLVLLAWNTRWRWPVVLGLGAFVVFVGLSRIYLGVHYPSDIMAGWAAAIAWVVGVYLVVFRGHLRPWGPPEPEAAEAP